MLNKSDRVLKERLQDRKEWVEYFSECLSHHNINDKVTNEFYNVAERVGFEPTIRLLVYTLSKRAP